MTRPAAAERKPFWPILTDYALLPDTLPRVLGAMALGAHCGTVARGSIKWWQPDYLRAPTAARVAQAFPPRDATIRESCIAAHVDRERAWRAPTNRAMRDAEVHLFAIDPARILAICTYEGEWRTAGGENRGRDMIELGMWRWSCKFGQAAHRIAKLLGWSSIPLRTDAA